MLFRIYSKCIIDYTLSVYECQRDNYEQFVNLFALLGNGLHTIKYVCKIKGVRGVCSKKIVVLGGDMRLVTLASEFYRDGYEVSVYGFSDDVEFDLGVVRESNLSDAVNGKDIVVMGLPVTNDDITVRTPLWDGKIYFYDVLKAMGKNQLLIGGKFTPQIKNMCNIYDVRAIDYFDREELTVLNAIPTAEGAIEIAMGMLPITVHGSKSLVLGFGRIGKVLAKDLHALGAEVYVEARRFDDLSWIKAYGYNGIYLPRLKEQLPLFDVIYNTVPYQIITEDMMKYIRKDCPFIDLASMPGGIDDDKAEKYGIKVVHALSLPGKSSPKTSGEIICHTVENILSDLGV